MNALFLLILARVFSGVATDSAMESMSYTWLSKSQKQPWKRSAGFIKIRVHRRKVCK